MKPLLLVPAPNAELLKIALDNGADGGYAPVKGLTNVRFRADYFGREQLAEIFRYAKDRGKPLYPVINGRPTGNKLAEYNSLIEFCLEQKTPGIVLGDWGLIRDWGQKFAQAGCQLVVSGMAGAINHEAVAFLVELGAKRVILPRLQSLKEIEYIMQKAPEVEYEVFMNGNLCPLYEGRGCFLKSIIPGYERGVCFVYPEEFKPAEVEGKTVWKIPGLPQLDEKPDKPRPLCSLPFSFSQAGGAEEIRPLWEPVWQSNLKLLPTFVRLGIKALKVIPFAPSPEIYQAQTALWRKLIDEVCSDEKRQISRREIADNSRGRHVDYELLLRMERG